VLNRNISALLLLETATPDTSLQRCLQLWRVVNSTSVIVSGVLAGKLTECLPVLRVGVVVM